MSYEPRLSAPSTSSRYYSSENPFYIAGYGMPNCTCYAWGRFYEIHNTTPRLSTGDAEEWWDASDGYSRSQIPTLGAIACWSSGVVGVDSDGNGHVAVVEQILSNGDIVTSNSAWGGENFYLRTLTRDSNYAYGGYKFQGFIYPNVDFSDSGLYPIDWISKNNYLTQSEMENNALIIARFFKARGWSINAVAAMLGNMEKESTINPGIWEGLYSNPETFRQIYGRYPGYGLVQWTPYTNYSEWAGSGWNTNQNKQLERIVYEKDNSIQFYPTSQYPITFRDFATSKESVAYLAGAFLYNYERPENPNAQERARLAEKWYDFIKDEWNSSGSGLTLPVWLLFQLRK